MTHLDHCAKDDHGEMLESVGSSISTKQDVRTLEKSTAQPCMIDAQGQVNMTHLQMAVGTFSTADCEAVPMNAVIRLDKQVRAEVNMQSA